MTEGGRAPGSNFRRRAGQSPGRPPGWVCDRTTHACMANRRGRLLGWNRYAAFTRVATRDRSQRRLLFQGVLLHISEEVQTHSAHISEEP